MTADRVLVSVGGGLLASASSSSQQNLGNNIIIIGLGIQITFFAFFMIITCIFHYRIIHHPTTRSISLTVPWNRALLVLYVVGTLIMIRSAYRLAEYVMGTDGVLQSREIYLYIFDSCHMASVVLLYNVFHPGKVFPNGKAVIGTAGYTDQEADYSLEYVHLES